MRTMQVIAAVFLCSSLAGAEENGPMPQAESRSIGNFSNIQAAGAIELAISQTAQPSVSVQADAAIAARVITEVQDDTLMVYVKGEQNTKPVKVTIGVPALKQLSMSGACVATLDHYNGKALTLNISGASKLNAQGTAEKVQLLASGAAEVKAKNFQADTETVQVAGAGQYEVCAKKSLSVIMNGASDVGYACSPGQLRKNIHGAGNVHAL